jgi:hypothetical protein
MTRRPTASELPRWIVRWLAISTPIVIWDALFVLLRPASLPGQPLGLFWAFAYKLYIAVDHSYADLNNHTVEALCIVSLLEACLVGLALWNHRQKRHAVARVQALVVTSLTGSKTVLFLLLELCSGGQGIAHNRLAPLLFVWLLPNILWVLFPLAAAGRIGRDLLHQLKAAPSPIGPHEARHEHQAEAEAEPKQTP